jgi:energy-coupling factor transport system ATP-binding protein
VALAAVRRLSFAYPGRRQALRDVSIEVEAGEAIAVFGPSGSGKSTLIRALGGLVPHFHGGRFEGRVEVCGLDTRDARPADLAGRVATVFQDPEDQVVCGRVEDELAFGLENVGAPPAEIASRACAALAALGSEHLLERRIRELSAGELQRVCLASALALEPELLLLDEPTSQLDPVAAEAFVRLACGLGCAVVISEQRPAGPLALCDRVLFLEEGRLVLDADRDTAERWLAQHRPAYVERAPIPSPAPPKGPVVCRVDGASFAYRGGPPVLERAAIEVRRGEIVALTGPNGSGKTTLAKVAAGLLSPHAGGVERAGRAAYLSQDPGRYLVRDRVDDEVALGVDGDVGLAAGALAEVGLSDFQDRHPRDLSSGERERLALAAVLVTDPDLLILDEPTRGVDPERKNELAALLRAQAARRSTLVVTHDRVFAAEVADRVVSLGVEEHVYA